MGLFGKKKTDDGGKEFGGQDGFLIKGIDAYEKYVWSATLYPDELLIKCITKSATGANGTEFVIKLSSIIDAQYSFDIDTITQSKSSLTKGLVGGALFGVPGAIVGSAPKTKTKNNVICNLLITYKSSSGEIKSILLRDNGVNVDHAAKLYDALKKILPKNKRPTKRIEL